MAIKSLIKLIFTGLLIALAASCTFLSKPKAAACQTFTKHLISTIATYSHQNPSLQNSADSPYLRSNRFLASFDPAELTPQQTKSWLNELKNLAIQSYKIELSRIPASKSKQLIANTKFDTVDHALTACANKAIANLNTPTAINIKDSYSKSARFFGVYPLLSALAQSSIDEYRETMSNRFLSGGSQAFKTARLYTPPPPTATLTYPSIKTMLANATADHPLGIPTLSRSNLNKLLISFAPHLEIEELSNDDQIGKIAYVTDNNSFSVKQTEPLMYTYPSYTRWQGQVLLQLNYAFWFPARPQQQRFDIYAGSLDGIIWRVTLGPNGKPLLFDSIHQCGCYHKLYLPQGTRHNFSDLEDEKPLAFAIDYHPFAPMGAKLKIEASTHYIVDVSTPSKGTTDTYYQLASYEQLLALPTSNTPVSLFGNSGIIEQSTRIERWFLWPLGVPNAGAMRQRGLHAIAFIGKRHFDDARLLDQFGIQIVD